MQFEAASPAATPASNATTSKPRANAAGTLTGATAASMIDHTLVRAEATRDDVLRLCAEAAHYRFTSVCVNAAYVSLACTELRNTAVKVACTIGFPLGATLTEVKVKEAAEVLRLGARELDMVLNVGALCSGDSLFVEADIRAVADLARRYGAPVKVAIETAVLDREQKEMACRLAVAAGADFIKTCSGYTTGGATVEDVELIRSIVGTRFGVKASGGVRNSAQMRALVAAGANRIGTSAGLVILRELQS
jgi:deoxyribose-phosphate aldolase